MEKQVFQSKFFFIVILALAIPILAFASGGIENALSGMRLNSKQEAVIDVWNNCKDVTNGTKFDLFVPFKTNREWTQFIANAPANVTFGICVDCKIPCTYPQICDPVIKQCVCQVCESGHACGREGACNCGDCPAGQCCSVTTGIGYCFAEPPGGCGGVPIQ